MKKTVFFLSTCLVASIGGFAQTNTPWSTTGNIGIGTTTPAVELEVDGKIETSELESGIVTTVYQDSYLSGNGDISGSNVLSDRAIFELRGTPSSDWLTDDWLLMNVVNENDKTALEVTRYDGIVVGTSTLANSATVYLGTDSKFVRANSAGDVQISVAGGDLKIGAFYGGGNGETGVYLGDDNHFIKSTFGSGVSIGTYGHSNGIVLLESGGKVGIGTATPSTKLHVAGGTRITNLAGSGTRMVVADLQGNLLTQAIPTFSGDNLGNHTATQNIELNGKFLSNDGGNEGVKIDDSGHVGIGTSPHAASQLRVNGGVQVDAGIGLNTAPSPFLALNANGDCQLSGFIGIGGSQDISLTHRLRVHGSAEKSSGGTSWATFSDKRLKNVEGNITGALDILRGLNPVIYTWNSLRNEKFGSDRPGKKFGFLAQELQQVIPEFVYEGGDGYLRYNPSGIEAILVAAIQEQSKTIDLYQERLNQLESKLTQCCQVGTYDTVNESDYNLQFQSTLSQNRPNPFSDRTQINYNLKDEFSQASIIVTDLNGTQLLSFNNIKEGSGNVMVSHSDLTPGIFLYSLILDGEIIDTKRMVLTN